MGRRGARRRSKRAAEGWIPVCRRFQVARPGWVVNFVQVLVGGPKELDRSKTGHDVVCWGFLSKQRNKRRRRLAKTGRSCTEKCFRCGRRLRTRIHALTGRGDFLGQHIHCLTCSCKEVLGASSSSRLPTFPDEIFRRTCSGFLFGCDCCKAQIGGSMCPNGQYSTPELGLCDCGDRQVRNARSSLVAFR
jgi:hypothetical protein